MTDVAEVVVRARPEGMKQTEKEMGDLEGSVDDTTDSLDDTATQFGDVSRKFRGAMAATVAGLAVAATGILSQVPVMRELADSFGMVLDSVALKLDGQLRPAVSEVSDEVVDLADDIAEADDAADIFLSTLETITDIEDIVIQATVEFVIDFDASDIFTTENLARGISLWLDRQIDHVDFPREEFAIGLEVWLDQAIEDAVDSVESWADGGKELARDFIVGVVTTDSSDLGGWLGDIADDFTDWTEGAVGWGRDLVGNLIRGIRERIGDLTDMLSNVNVAPGITVGDLSTAVDIGSTVVEAGRSGGGDSGFIGSVGGGGGGTYLDGRRVDDNQGRFRKDSLTRRGG